MVRVIFPMLTLMIVGCSSFAARTMNDYDQGGVSSAKFSKDSEACDKQATADQRTMGAGSMDPSHGTYNRMYDACMRASGYQPKPK